MSVITSVSGSITHNSPVIITGSGFGSKATAAPVVWDNCSGDDVLDLWDVNYNYDSPVGYEGAYRTPALLGRGVALPHSNISKYFCGAHYTGSTALNGRNVGVAKNRTVSSYPCYTYMSYYHRADPNFDWSPDSTDDNYKEYCWARGDWPYPADGFYWYLEYYFRESYKFNDGSGTALSGDSLYQGAHWNVTSRWAKVEIEIIHTTASSGRIRVWEDGKLVVEYNGSNTWSSTGTYTEMIGGYARDRGISNWRYWADMYYDTSLCRVVIGNSGTYNNCTIREVQIPTSWTDTRIAININKGVFGSSGTVYLYVIDSAGNVSPAKAITLGYEEIPTPPVVENVLIYATPINLTVTQVTRFVNRIAISAGPILTSSSIVGSWASPGHINFSASPIAIRAALNFSADLSTIIPPIEDPIIEEEWKEEGEGPWNFTQADNKQGSSIYGYWYKGVSPTGSPVWEI